MKSILSIVLVFFLSLTSGAQLTKASLQASGLTCSMCSKAVKTALEEVRFVEKVQVDIKNQQYNISFRKDQPVSLDALAKAVEEAGFSIAALKVTADFNNVTVGKDNHVKLGDHYFHFLNAKEQQLSGSTTFTLVDKQYVSDKTFKKYSTSNKMECVQTGRAAKCCVSDGVAEQARIYHAVI